MLSTLHSIWRNQYKIIRDVLEQDLMTRFNDRFSLLEKDEYSDTNVPPNSGDMIKVFLIRNTAQSLNHIFSGK